MMVLDLFLLPISKVENEDKKKKQGNKVRNGKKRENKE